MSQVDKKGQFLEGKGALNTIFSTIVFEVLTENQRGESDTVETAKIDLKIASLELIDRIMGEG